ncbi:MAG: alpha/beta hydrolase [Micropepsaceae bacterium]
MKAFFALIFALVLGGAALAAPTRFTVTVSGEGPDIILIPGLSSAPHVFDGLAPMLEATHRVHRIQIAGFAGLAAGPNAEGDILDGVRDELIAYIGENGLKKPALIGHSMGGLLSLLVAAKAPDAVGRVMVIDALPFFSLLINPMATSDMVKPFAAQAKAQMMALSDEQFAASQRQTLAILTKTPDGVEKALVDSLASDRAVVAETMAEVMVRDARSEIPAITVPVTVLQAWDNTMPAQKEAYVKLWADAYAALPGVQMKVIENSYHFIMWDQPQAFADAVTAFLAE